MVDVESAQRRCGDRCNVVRADVGVEPHPKSCSAQEKGAIQPATEPGQAQPELLAAPHFHCTGRGPMGLIAVLLTTFLVIGLRRPEKSDGGRPARTVLAVVVPVFVAMFVLILNWEVSG
jgi:hypothetical protein